MWKTDQRAVSDHVVPTPPSGVIVASVSLGFTLRSMRVIVNASRRSPHRRTSGSVRAPFCLAAPMAPTTEPLPAGEDSEGDSWRGQRPGDAGTQAHPSEGAAA